MKLGELNQLCEKLQETREKYLDAIKRYLEALDNLIKKGRWWELDFNQTLKTLNECKEYCEKEIARLKPLIEEG